MEPLEPRLLLSADFMPAAAEAIADGFDLFEARLEEFLASESSFDQRVPFLLQPNDNDSAFEAPTAGDLFSIPVDTNRDEEVGGGGSNDENVLAGWDADSDGVVNTAELLDALLFVPLQQELAAIDPGDDTDSFVDALVNNLDLSTGKEGIDVTLDELGGDFTLEFDLISATNLTEDPDAEVVFDLQFSLTLTRDNVPIDLGLEADELKLLAFNGDSLEPQPVDITVDSTLKFGLEFGVYTGGQNEADLDADDFFIRHADEMLFSITAVDNDVDFNLNIGFLGAEVVDGEIDLQADFIVDLLDPNSPEVLGFDTSQYGDEQPGGVVIGTNPVPAADLSHDAGFVLRIGEIGIATDILVADDNNNAGNNDLIADVQAAIDAAGLGELVTADLTGSDELRLSLVNTDPGELGFDAESLDLGGALIADNAPTNNQPLANVSFLLSVGGALPRLVTVRAPGSERDDIGFDANQAAELLPLTAQAAANGSGTLDEGGDTTANLDLRITESDGTVTSVSVTVEESDDAGADPNGSVADLVADINQALTDAGVDTLVSAGHSGGTVSLTGKTGVSAIEILSADDVTENDIGFAAGQGTFLTITAPNPIGDPSFDDGLDNTFDDARFTITLNGVDHTINVAADSTRDTNLELATAISNALSDAGLALSAQVESGHIVLKANNNSVESFEVTTGNQNLDDLLYDLNNALVAAGFTGADEVVAADDGGNIQLTSTGGDSLEITNTLTFDAGVRGAELDGAGDPPDASFEAAIGEESNLTFTLPVEVKDGLRAAGTTDNFDPQDMAIVGNFNPLDSSLTTFVATEDTGGEDPEDVNRFFLDYSVNPPVGEDPLEPIPNPVPDNTLELINFAEALQFNRIGAGSFIGMLEQLGTELDSIMQDPAFAAYGIPFTDATLTDLVLFEDMIINSLIYDTGADGVFNGEEGEPVDDSDRLLFRRELEDGTFEALPAFTTAQEMGERLTEILSMPLFDEDGIPGSGAVNPTYDPDSNELTFDLNIISSNRVSVGVEDPETGGDSEPADAGHESFTPAFQFNVDLFPFDEFTVTPAGVDGIPPEDLLVNVEARTVFSGTYGFDLTPEIADPELDTLQERFFIRDATMGGAFTASLPDAGVAGTAMLGLVGVDVDVNGTFGAQFSARLQAEGGAPGSQVTLEALQNDIRDTNNELQPALEVVTDPVVDKLTTLDYDGQDGVGLSNFAPGSRIVSGSGGSAYVLEVEDNGATGTATLFGVGGVFADDDFFVDVTEVADGGIPLRGGVVDGGPVTPAFFGELDMTVEVQDGFDEAGFGSSITSALDGLSGNVDLNLAVFGDPNNDIVPAVDSADLNASLDLIGDLSDFVELGYSDLVTALEGLRDLISDLESSYPVLSQVLPVVNRSVSDLLGLSEGVDRALASARSVLADQQALLGVENDEVPTLTLQGMAAALRGAFGLPDDEANPRLVIDTDMVNGTPFLTLDFDVEQTVSTTLGMDIDLGEGIPNLTSPKVLRADGSLGWGFKIGVNLDDPADVQLFNPDGGLDGELSITGEGAEGTGLVFLAQVGEMPVQVMDALVDIQLDFDLGGLNFSDSDGIKSLADVKFGDFTPNIDAQDYDISIPLFDVEGGLTGFLGEISALGSNIIDDAQAILDNGLLDANALDELSGLVDDFVAELDGFDPLDNLLLLTDTADLFFETIQDLLDEATNIGIPLIGDNLSDGARFIEGFRSDFISKFRQLIANTNDITTEDVTEFIEGFFSDIGLDIDVTSEELVNDVEDEFDDEVRWMLSLGQTYDVPFDLGFDLGVPLLDMELDMPLTVELDWNLDIGLGVNREDGAFIILNEADDGKELDVDLTVDLPSSDLFRGQLAFLELVVENKGSGMQFDFDIDLSNTAGGDTLPIADLGNLGFDTEIGGGKLEDNDHLLSLELSAGVKGLDVVFPRIATDFIMDWSLSPQGVTDNVIGAGLDLLKFEDVRLDLTSFADGFLGDVLTKLDEVLGPFDEIASKLTEPLPFISDLFELFGQDPVTLIDLAGIAGGEVNTEFLDALDEISDLAGTLNSLTGEDEAFLSIGDLEIFGDGNDLLGNALFDGDMDIDDAIVDAVGSVENFLADAGDAIDDFDAALDGQPASETKTAIQSLNIGDPGALFSFPFLDNPASILGLFVGQDVLLAQADLPPLGVGFDFEQFTPIFGPLGGEFSIGFFVGADFSFGFDTFGLNRFADSEFTNPALIFDGFFLGDREAGDDNLVTTGTDIPEVFLEMSLKAAAELNLGIASASIGGGVTARIGWDLFDPDNDGAVHISEIANTINISDGDPLSIFDLQGALLAEMFWRLVIDFGVTKFETGDTIFEQEVFDFNISFDRPPVLATDLGNGTLALNMGPNAVDRLNGDNSDGNEVFEIDYDGGDIRVRSPALGVNDWQVYSGDFDHIIGLGGQGNDSMTFTGFDESDITFDLRGGVGDDVIEFIEDTGVSPATGTGAVIRGGAGNDRLIGSHLDDEIYGGLGDDEIEGGRGYDVLFGDDGDFQDGVDTDKSIGARVSPRDGNDTIAGGDQDDIIIGGGGVDDLAGDGGRDVILGDAGRFGFNLTDGHLDVNAFDIPEFVPNDRLDDNPDTSTEDKIQAILSALTGIFTGTDLGTGADDVIDGGADGDIIFGGAANDTVSGGTGGDHVVGGKGFDTINGNAGHDVLFGNEQDDVIEGDSGNDVIAGGFGDDELHGNAGNDFMTGSRGRDVMYGDAGDDELHGQGEPDIMFGGADDDLLVGGVGADIMMGDDGIVVKFDGLGPDNNLVIGKGDAALADPFEAGADSIKGSLDLILTDVEEEDGDDILSGGEGGDIILGGGGNDLGGGDVDPRSGTANDESFTTPDGEDILVGDGGVVEFNERRLQRIASVYAGDPNISFRDTLYGDNGDDVIIGGRGSDGDDDGNDPTLNIPSLGIPFLLAGGHGPGRGPTDAEASDQDIILGDNGELVYVGADDTENFGELAFIQTTDTSNATGGADTVFGEEDDDIILGGVNGSVDVLGGSTGEDVILGDNGLIHFYYDWQNDGNIQDFTLEDYTPNDGDPATIDVIRSFHDGLGGVDVVSGEEAADVLLGGEAGDFVFGDNAAADSGASDLDDVMLGDNGDIFLAGDTGKRLVQGVAIDLITTTDVAEGTGGADVMSGNAGADIVIGGVNGESDEIVDEVIDHLYGDARNPVPGLDGDDIILGDNGLLDYTWDDVADTDRLTLDLIETTAQAGGGVRGGVDYIFGNAGDDTAFGGSGDDLIFGDNDESVDLSGVADTFGNGAGADILFGDQGKVELINNLPTLIETTDQSGDEGGADHIQGNDFDDIILGGVAGDELHGEAFLTAGKEVADLVTTPGSDTIIGDEGRLFFNIDAGDVLVTVNDGFDAMGDGDPLTLDLVETFATGSLGGDDEIYGNDDDDLAMGGFGDDLIHGDFYLGSLLVRAPNPGSDDLLGDGGQKFFQAKNAIVLRSIETDQGGSDTIHGNDGDDTIMGGMFDDLLYGETDAAHLGLAADRAGEDIILGDNGRLDWILPDDTVTGRQDVIDAFGGTTISVDDEDPSVGWMTLDRITTIAPTHGGNDVIYGNGNSAEAAGDVVFGGTGNDHIYGDTDEAAPDGADGVDGSDLLFGDHGKLYPTLPAVDGFFVNNNFFSIDTQEADGADFDGGHNDFADFIQGNAASDILIGGQDDDVLLGGTGDDDLIGGHNVAGGHDELDDMPGADQLAISPASLADLDPSDVNEINDIMDGGEDDDVLAGDNAIVIRQLDDLSPRFRMTANGLLYTLESDTVDNLADIDVGFSADVTAEHQPHQDMALVRTVTLLDHSEAIETNAADNPNDPRVFGNDVMAGAAQDDEMFGQLGDDIIQGDGAIRLTAVKDEEFFDPFSPAQDADPSFDLRNVTQRVDLMAGNDTDWTLRFDVFESLADGDDYIEGNGGNDRIYGNLGQDDIIGGSSTLFGLGDADAAFHGVATGNDLRPDGADLIYGGAGNPALLSRNASFGGVDNDISGDTIVPDVERHATDADTILGDNGDIFRIVVDTDPETEGDQIGYSVFNYDRDATVASGFEDDGFDTDELTLRVRAVNLEDYGYTYVNDGDGRESLQFLATARGEGDLIYGESGDDLVHGMTGDDVIFGNSEHDDLHGEIGNDFILGGTGIDGVVGDDGLILTSRNSDQYGEELYGIEALLPEQTNLKKNESPDPRSLNAEITTPGNIQRAIINVENELTKSVELFAFRTDDLEGTAAGEFGAPIRFNDVIFGGQDNDFIHAGDGDDAVSGSEALPVYYSGEGFELGPDQAFTAVNSFLQDMQNSPPNGIPVLTDNPFWFDFAPYNPGDILRFEGKEILDENGQNARTRDEFAWYDEFNPRRKLMFDFDAAEGDISPLATLDGVANPIDFILNFDETEGPDDTRFSDGAKPTDGDDRLFGDVGNDWMVGGSGRDHMFGGRGNDLLNMDDDHDSGFSGRVGPHDPEPDPLDNKDPDEYQAYADIVYSGAGRDVMILNTGADRAIDWVGEFNSYIVPFSPFGAFHISRTLQPQVPEFLHALSVSDGVDANVDASLDNTNALDGQLFVDQKNADVRTDDPDPLRNFEPYGELGMVRQTDFDWQEQTGAPNDPQPGNLQGKREIMRRELFNDPGAAVPLAADEGILSITSSGTLQAEPETLGGEVVGLYPLDTLQPTYTELLVTLNVDKDKAGTKSNGYVIFDYQGPENFKFAGLDVGINKLQIGHRDATGWVVDVQIPVRVNANTDYDLTIALFGSQATVYLDENENVSHDFGEPLNDGGMVGLGTDNATARFDDLQIQTLPPQWTFVNETGFDTAADNPFTVRTGAWNVSDGRLHASSEGQIPAVATDSIDVAAYTRLELLGTLNSDNKGGFVFDYYGDNEFKFVTLDVQNDEVLIGHYLDGKWSVDAVVGQELEAGVDYSLMVTLFGSTASVTLDGKAVVAHTFGSILNDGHFGVLNVDGDSHLDDFLVRGDDPAYAEDALMVEGGAAAEPVEYSLDESEILDMSSLAVELLDTTFSFVDDFELEDVSIEVMDLADNKLAVYRNGSIIIDDNAAGYGWHTDASSEVEGIDLLSVLLHEYGHAMGLEHDSGFAFMADELGVGERYSLSEDDAVMVFDEDTGELVDENDESMEDDLLLVDEAVVTDEDETEQIIHWGHVAAFLSGQGRPGHGRFDLVERVHR